MKPSKILVTARLQRPGLELSGRRRAERALTTVVATCDLLGAPRDRDRPWRIVWVVWFVMTPVVPLHPCTPPDQRLG